MSRSVKVCTQIMRHVIEEGYTNEISETWLERAIILARGADKRTILNWKRALEVHGFVERKSVHVYKINLLKCPELLTDLLKGDKQKKLL